MHQAEIAADAMLDVHDEIADGEALQIFDEGLGLRDLRCASFLPHATTRARTEDVFLGDEREALRRRNETMGKLADGDRDDVFVCAARF